MGWLKRRYFSAGAKGAFAIRGKKRDGENVVVALHRMIHTKIERHIKVRGEANRFDPEYTEYFERRRCFAWRVLSPGGTACQKVPAVV